MANAIMYPALSKVFGTEEEISLSNTRVEEWSSRVLPELAQLYSSSGKDISFQSESGKDITLVPIPHSQDERSFIVNETKTKWIPNILSLIFGNRVSASEGAGWLRSRLDTYYDGGQTQSESDDCTGDDENVSYSMLNIILCIHSYHHFSITCNVSPA